MNCSWIFPLGLNYNKYVKKINKIINEQRTFYLSNKAIFLIEWTIAFFLFYLLENGL